MIWSLGRVVLIVLGLLCLSLLVATPDLIKPFPKSAPWYESAAMFPRMVLGLALVGGVAEFWLRRKNPKLDNSDELDSSAANISLALQVAACFVGYCFLVPVLGYLTSTCLFLLISGRLVKLSWKTSLVLAIGLSIIMWAVFKVGLKVAFGHGIFY